MAPTKKTNTKEKPPADAPPKLTPEQIKEKQQQTLDRAWESVTEATNLEHRNKAKVLLTGPTGSGKTEVIAKMPRPLIGLTEMQGLMTILRVNPKARVFLIKSPQDIQAFKFMLRDPRLPERVDSVALDGLTDCQRIIKQNYLNLQASQQVIIDKSSWSLINESTSRLARIVRDAPVHSVVTCLDKEEREDEQTIHRPNVSGGRLPNELGQYFNLVGFMHVRDYGNGLRHQVLFRGGDDRYMTKKNPALDDIEPPEPHVWLSKVFGSDVPQDVLDRVNSWRALGQSEQGLDDDEDKADDAANASAAAAVEDAFRDD